MERKWKLQNLIQTASHRLNHEVKCLVVTNVTHPRMKESPKIQFWPCDYDISKDFGSHPRVAETEGALIILGIFISSIWISFGAILSLVTNGSCI